MAEPGAVRAFYDAAAATYAARLPDLRAEAPVDRAMLAAFAEHVGAGNPVLDAGCGTGRLRSHLESLGLRVVGVDLSSGMVRHAAIGGAPVAVSALGDLPFGEECFAGVLAWYSLIHTDPADPVAAFAEMGRVLLAG